MVEWFDLGGTLNLGDTAAAREVVAQARNVQGLVDLALTAPASPPMRRRRAVAAAIDFVLEGLYSQKKIGRTEDRGYHGTEPAPAARTAGGTACRAHA